MYKRQGIICELDQNGVCNGQAVAPITRTVTVPSDVGLFFPVLNGEIDSYLTPDVFSVVSYCLDLWDANTNQYTDPTLCAERQFAGAANLSVEIDGVAVDGLGLDGPYHVHSPKPFSYDLPDHNFLGAFGVTDVAAHVTNAGQDGVYVMVNPLKSGKHTIHFAGQVLAGGQVAFALDVTYDLTVKD